MFTPRYLLVNQSSYMIQIQEFEVSNAPWIKLGPKSVLPFWPKSKKPQKSIYMKCENLNQVTLPVTYTTPVTVLLRLDNKVRIQAVI